MKTLVDAPIFGMLRTRLDMLSTRQTVIAENVANVSTPGYVPRDVDMDSFETVLSRATQTGGSRSSGGVSLAATDSGHFPGRAMSSSGNSVARETPDSETTLDGNSVIIEEQMLKLNETRMDYDMALGLYQKALSFVRLAGKGPMS